mgnify:CR=1 FL=1
MKKRAVNFQFRPAILEEREEFYKKEFSIDKVKKWFKNHNMVIPQLCAIDAGSDSEFIKNKKWKDSMFYFHFSKLKEKINKYVPEDIYYDRNLYKNPEKKLKNIVSRDFFSDENFISQELVFDIDSDNIKCNHTIEKKVCNKCLNKSWYYSLKIKKLLKKNFDFNKMSIVYSGRGFHVHIFDEKAFFLNKKEREKIVNKFLKFPIDPWVSRGHIDLIRLPYSLNALVSREVIPIDNKNTFRKNTGIPKFLKKQAN